MKKLIRYIVPVLAAVMAASCGGNKHNAEESNPAFQNPAVKGLTDKINEDPKNARLYYDRGRALHQLQEDSLALNDFKKAVSIDSGKSEYYSAIGDLLFEHKDISGSTHYLEKALKLNPKDPHAHLKLAKMFFFMKDYTSAFSEINTVLRQDVYNPEGYFLKGMIYKDLKDTVNALNGFRTAVEMDPNYREALVQLGLLYSAKHDPLALKYFDNAFKADTMDVFPLFAKGVYYQDQKAWELAKAEYRNVIMHDRQYANAYYNTAYIFLQQDSLEKAYKQYDILTKIDPADAEAYYNRGLCNEKMGKKADAITDYKQALVFDEKYPEPREALKRLGAQ